MDWFVSYPALQSGTVSVIRTEEIIQKLRQLLIMMLERLAAETTEELHGCSTPRDQEEMNKSERWLMCILETPPRIM